MVCYSLFTQMHYKDTHYILYMLQFLLKKYMNYIKQHILAQTQMPLTMEIQVRGIMRLFSWDENYSSLSQISHASSSLVRALLPSTVVSLIFRLSASI